MIVIIAATGTNIMSIKTAVERLGHKVQVSNDAQTITKASHVILPGVGSAQMGMRQLDYFGLVELIPKLTNPVLGICLGMQLLFEKSKEHDVDCLGVIPGVVSPLKSQTALPVPHMGWNQLKWVSPTPLAKNISDNAYVYFVHSYAVNISESCLAESVYGISFAAAVQKNNFYGMQFHPEKSGDVGSQLLENFCAL